MTQLSDEVFENLLHLARGNVDLIEEAFLKTLKSKGFLFWKKWYVDLESAAKYIADRQKEIDKSIPEEKDSPDHP